MLHAFARDRTEGYGPQAGLILDAQGNLYGTTNRGGGDPNDLGHGVVFAILAGSGTADSSNVQTLSPSASLPLTSEDLVVRVGRRRKMQGAYRTQDIDLLEHPLRREERCCLFRRQVAGD